VKTVEQLQKAIELLPAPELARFRTWFEMFDSDRFDAAIKRDAGAGKLDTLAEEAIVHYRTGQSRDL
jgi:hypothetical protein